MLLLCLLSIGLAGPVSADPKALFDAAQAGDLARVRALVEAGASVDAENRYKVTPLFFAAMNGHLDVVDYLIAKGADVNQKDSFYKVTAFEFAMWNEHLEVAARLIAAGSDGADQLFLVAAEAGKAEIVRGLLPDEKITGDHVAVARENAREQGHDAVVGVLTDVPGKVDTYAEMGIDAAALERYTGTFHNARTGSRLDVEMAGSRLRAKDANRVRNLIPRADGDFGILGDTGIRAHFQRDGEKITGIQIKRGERTVATYLAGLPSRVDEPAIEVASSDLAIAPRRDPARWPSFRRPEASGVADGQGIPVRWDAEKGTNIAWKTSVPGIATASPIIWEGRIFTVTAVSGKGDDSLRAGLYGDVDSVEDLTPHKFIVAAYGLGSGKQLWERVVTTRPPEVKRHLKSTQANSTPVTDGRHLVSVFGSIGLLVCHDLDGNELWRTDVGAMDNGWFFDKTMQWGHSSSPVIFENLVILQVDVQEGSHMAAYSLADGKLVWKTPREGEIPTWGTPTVYRGARPEIITNGTRVRGYDPRTGTELWSLGPNSEITVATPVIAEDLFLVTAGYPPVRPIYAIKAGSKGDISPGDAETTDAISWHKGSGGTYLPTPIVYRGYFYTCANDGRLTCYEVATGKQVYRARLPGRPSFSASPVASDGRIYFASETGEVHVIAAGPEFKQLARNEMGEIMMATPAISDGVMVIRTRKHLFGVSEKAMSN